MSIQPDWYLKYKKKPEEKIFENIVPKEAPKPKRRKYEESPTPKSAKDLIEILSVKEVADYMKCDISYVYDLIRLGKLQCQPYGRRRLVPVTSLHAFLESEKQRYYAENV